MYLKEFFAYKNQLMEDLCKNEKIVKMVTGNPDARVPNHDLPYRLIYPYEYVPETVDEGRTFICFDVDVDGKNKTYYNPIISIWPFTHKSRMRLEDGGLLLDELASEIDMMLNGNRTYGLGQLELESAERFVPIRDYQGRTLIYTTRDFNRGIRGKQTSKRKAPSYVDQRLAK